MDNTDLEVEIEQNARVELRKAVRMAWYVLGAEDARQEAESEFKRIFEGTEKGKPAATVVPFKRIVK